MFLNSQLAAEFASTTGRRATFPPRNVEALPISARRRFNRQFDVGSIVADAAVDDGLIEHRFDARFAFTCAGLRIFRVAGER